MVEPNGIDELSEREKEILRLVATGASNKEIAQQLVISPNTVKVHLRNIFAKIGVASRTEATVYAIQQGYVQVAGPTQLPTEADLASGSTDSARTGQAAPRSRIQRRLLAVLGGVSVLGLLAALAWRTITPAPTTVPAPTPMRWETRSPLPTARSRLAATAYDDQIYAIGGETSEGVTGQVERYDPASDTWAPLNAKPTAVADVSAVVIGGQIYVPGGRLASGQVTDVLEVFDPQRNDWRQQAPLPRPLSAYAVVAFEGRLLLFGGWDGRQFVSDAYAYAPDQDAWTALSPMLTARGFAGAAVAGGQVYVIGGYDGKEALDVSEVYVPERQNTSQTDWIAEVPLPERRYGCGVISVADTIYVVGGESPGDHPLPALGFSRQRATWEAIQAPPAEAWSYMGLVALEKYLYALGGQHRGAPSNLNVAYQAVYTISFPIVK